MSWDSRQFRKSKCHEGYHSLHDINRKSRVQEVSILNLWVSDSNSDSDDRFFTYQARHNIRSRLLSFHRNLNRMRVAHLRTVATQYVVRFMTDLRDTREIHEVRHRGQYFWECIGRKTARRCRDIVHETKIDTHTSWLRSVMFLIHQWMWSVMSTLNIAGKKNQIVILKKSSMMSQKVDTYKTRRRLTKWFKYLSFCPTRIMNKILKTLRDRERLGEIVT